MGDKSDCDSHGSETLWSNSSTILPARNTKIAELKYHASSFSNVLKELEKVRFCTHSRKIIKFQNLSVLSSPPPIPAGLARVLQDSSGLCPTLPSSAKLGRTGTEFGRISAEIKYIMEIFKCHVTLSNNSLYTDNLILRTPQIFSFRGTIKLYSIELHRFFLS